MKARYVWTLAAVGLVVVFFATRAYVGQAIEAEFERPIDKAPQTVRTPDPEKPRPERKREDPLGSARPHVEALRAATSAEFPTAETWASAHAAVDALLAIELEDWTPRSHIRVLDQLAEAAQDLDDVPPSPAGTELRNRLDKAYATIRSMPVEGSSALRMPAGINTADTTGAGEGEGEGE